MQASPFRHASHPLSQNEADAIIRAARDYAAAEIGKAKAAADKESASKIAAAKAKLDAELKAAVAALESQRASSMSSLDKEVTKLVRGCSPRALFRVLIRVLAVGDDCEQGPSYKVGSLSLQYDDIRTARRCGGAGTTHSSDRLSHSTTTDRTNRRNGSIAPLS
jgi:hypothetical protein